jgi:hypothetical protein
MIIIMTTIVLTAARSQNVAVKTNVLYDVTSTINLGLEFAMAPKWTLDLPVNYNAWILQREINKDGDEVQKKIKHWLIQPELRRWFCGKFYGNFLGFHGLIGGYNVGGIGLFGLDEERRYEGNIYGAGVSYGYHWILNTRWSIEATVGVGYAYLGYAKYPCTTCAPKLEDASRNYFGPTKAGISLIYIIR